MNQPAPRSVDTIVVHCSATRGSQDIGRAEIDRWHRERGFSGVGYHYIIRRDGQLELGRPEAQIGAHAAGHNARSIGICLVGGLNEQLRATNNFTREQWDTLTRVLEDVRTRYPAARILGHRDLPNVRKDCPCFDVRGWCAQHGIDPEPR